MIVLPKESAIDRTNSAMAPAAGAFAEIEALLGDRLSTSVALRERHGQDESYHPAHLPDAVAFPTSTEEVSSIASICTRYRIPIIPFGAGTSLEGNIAALKGGVCIDLGGMNRIIAVNVDDMDMRVEAGVTRKQVNTHIKDTGLFFPVDPGADATIGGMASTCASGTTTVRYGTMRDNVLGLSVVLPDGRVVQTGTRARKSAAGYDLTRLFVGAEGTLGIITEVQLRLQSVPQAITAAVCPFPTLEGAVTAVIQTIHMGIPVARIELLDEIEMRAVNRFSNLAYPEQPTLFFEFHGSEASAAEQAELVGEITRSQGASEFQWATRTEDRNRLWQARHDALYAARALRAGAKVMITDVCVPISKLTACILETRADIDASGLTAPIVGHVGDGNFHVLIVIMPDDILEVERAMGLNDRLVGRALSAGGTCTGEHGIGYGKIGYLEREQAGGIDLMHSIKRAIDPYCIMNPGKIFRPASGAPDARNT
jgi:D-lactate dehydrogenase (cytochrome)